MPHIVLTDPFVSINTVDLSDHVARATLTYSAAIFETPVGGDTGSRRLAGFKDAVLDVEFYQDYAAAEVDATLFSLLGVQTAVACRGVKGSAISATNPEFQFNGMLEAYNPFGGQVGQPHMTTARFQQSDGIALIRDVTP